MEDNETVEQLDENIKVETDDSPILRVSSLYKSFGRKEVVRGVDFSMKTGEVLGLLGPNGAGKTTTFYMVVGFYKPTAGDVFLNDKCITRLPMYKRARLGIVAVFNQGVRLDDFNSKFATHKLDFRISERGCVFAFFLCNVAHTFGQSLILELFDTLIHIEFTCTANKKHSE